MKKYLKIFSLLLVVALTLGFSGCGKDDTEEPEVITPTLTTEESITMFTNYMDFDNANFTLDIFGDYAISMQPEGEATQSQSDSFNATLKLANHNTYLTVANDFEQYTIGDWVFDKDVEDTLWYADYSNDLDSTFSNEVVISALESVMGESMYNLTHFNSDWVTSTHLESGAYKLTVGTNLKEELAALGQSFITNGDATLESLINSILEINYGESFTIANLVTDIKANINETSTIEDAVLFLGQKFGVKLDETIGVIELFTEENMLDANLFASLEIANSTEFATMLDSFVTDYLQDTELTFESFLNSFTEADDAWEFISIIKDIYNSLNTLQSTNLSFELAFTSTPDNTNISAITANVLADISIMGVRYTLAANVTLTFTDINTTTITAPNFDMVEEFEMSIEIWADDLTADTAFTLSNFDLGSTNFVLTRGSETTQTITYDATAHTLVLSADAVNYLISSNYISFYNSETSDYIYIDLAYQI